MRNVSIIGIGETKMGKHPNRSLRSLIEEAGSKAIADAGIEKERIQSVFVGNFNGSFLAYQSHIGPMVTEVLGLKNIPALRTEGACASGSLAFRQGYMAIASGLCDIVLVGGVEKMTHQPTEIVTTGIASASDYEMEASLGMTFPSIFAMIANRYFYEYRNVREEMALCAVSNHNNAMLNPDAQMQKLLLWIRSRMAFLLLHHLRFLTVHWLPMVQPLSFWPQLTLQNQLARRESLKLLV